MSPFQHQAPMNTASGYCTMALMSAVTMFASQDPDWYRAAEMMASPCFWQMTANTSVTGRVGSTKVEVSSHLEMLMAGSCAWVTTLTTLASTAPFDTEEEMSTRLLQRTTTTTYNWGKLLYINGKYKDLTRISSLHVNEK